MVLEGSPWRGWVGAPGGLVPGHLAGAMVAAHARARPEPMGLRKGRGVVALPDALAR